MGIKNRFLKALTIFFIPLFISGCAPDLGIFEKDDLNHYYDSFGEVEALYDGGSETYSVEDSLYNSYTVEELDWEKGKKKVEEQPYLYIVLPFKVNLKIQAMVLYFYCQKTTDMNLSLFYFNKDDPEIPQKIKYLTSPETEIVDEEEVKIDYDDPKVEDAIFTGQLALKGSKWTSLVFDHFQQKDHYDNFLYAASGGLLYLRVENNSGFNKYTMTSLSFSFINLMVRAVE